MSSTVEVRARTGSDRFPRTIAVIAGLSFVAFGLWALVAPSSFFDAVAEFEPYNRHFLQDIGAFQLGLGAVLLAAAVPARPDALTAGLLGTGVGAAAHVVSHAVGHDLGGTPAVDIPVFSVMAALLLAAGFVRWSQLR